ncbi:hypothetical protein ACFSAG_14710 [Sphingorhabdus buctiana]|uniref:SnoaL-like domain-containing protein n=2 Tax=Sphingorhabdus TaxID=1434046 RepID=A0A6I6L3N6_9SPHN|nr:hypothetical protein [Sphingorhabdus lacus]QGY80375.1 hypothetical protein EUU25_06925 [Sphingorhabdus lacus]
MTCNLKTRLALLALMCAPSLSAAAHETPVQAAPADVVQELHAFYADQDQANRDGLTSTELAERFYSHDVIITGEGDVAARRGIEASVKALDDWFAYLGPNGNKGCAFAVQDTVVSSDRDMASVFAVLTCQPNPPATTKQETIRQLFVLKRTVHGWRVVREMWQAGGFGN